MKLKGLYINGFGLFQDIKIDGLSPELTIFLGNNESGKSTLLGFIRAMLFGFPDGRSSENSYPPIFGGRHGGIIELSLDNGESYILERYPGAGGGKVEILKPDQTREGKDLLDRTLGIRDKNLYKNIYAFSLTELQDFETLNTESIRESLFSAGAGVDTRGLINLKSGLEKTEADLFKSAGKKPKINSILSRIIDIEKEIKALLYSINDYDDLRSRIGEISKEIDLLEKEKIDLSSGLKKIEKWLTIWPEWVKLSIANERLLALDPIKTFPSQGIARLEGLNSRLDDLKDELFQKEEKFRQQELELSLLKADKAILSNARQIRRLQEEQQHVENLTKDLLSLEKELAAAEQRLKKNLNNLGPSWTENMVMKFDLSVSVHEEVRNLREGLNQSNAKVQRKRDSLEDANARKKEALNLTRDFNEPAVKDMDRLNSMMKQCAELKGLIIQEQTLDEKRCHAEERLNDLREENRILEEGLGKAQMAIPFWPAIAVMGAGVISFEWFGFNKQMELGILILVISLIFGFAIWFLKKRMKSIETQRRSQSEQRNSLIMSKMADLEGIIDVLNNSLENIREQINAKGPESVMPKPLSPESIEQMEYELQESRGQLRQWLDLKRSLIQANERYDDILKQVEYLETEYAEILDSWNNWLKSRGLNPGLSPDGALETLSIIRSSREQIENLVLIRSRIQYIEETKSRYLDLAKNLLDTFGRFAENDKGVRNLVYDLISDLNEIEKADQAREMLQKDRETNIKSIKRYKVLISEVEQKIEELMIEGGANTEEMFRKRASIFEKRLALEREAEGYQDSIRRLSGELGKQEKVMKDLTKLNIDRLEEQKITRESQLSQTEEKLDSLKREQAKLEERSRQLINDERISILGAEEERLKEELSVLAEEWITAVLAQKLIRMSRSKYEKERQPKIISEAGKFFCKLTSGQYTSLVSPLGENRIDVISRDGSKKEIGQLSRGTAEQLYLALRFGFILEFSKNFGSLPIIMDEILVNFDQDRSKAAINAIIDLSKKHQVLFFTCHPETTRLFKEVEPNLEIQQVSNREVRRLLG